MTECVNTINGLRARDPPGPGAISCLTVEGYHVSGDGGGGSFYWDDSLFPDLTLFPSGEDGGIIIKPTDVAASIHGRWKRVIDKPLNIRWFGARGDGASNDSNAIQNAIKVASLNGGTIYFPTGTYHVSVPLVLNNSTNISINGDGPSSIIDFDVIDGGVIGSNVTHVLVQDLQIGGKSGRAIIFDGISSSIIVRNCLISGATKAANPATAAVSFYGVTDGTVENCELGGNGFGASNSQSSLCIHVSHSHRIRILYNNCSSSNVTMGIGVENSTDVFVHGNNVYGPVAKPNGSAWGYGIYFYYSDAATEFNICSDNQIHHTDGTGIYLNASPHTLIRGNIVEDTCRTLTGTSLAIGGIALNIGSKNCTVSDNIIQTICNVAQRYPGIRFDASNTRLSSNVISNTMGEGILLVGSPNDSIVLGNTVLNSGLGGITSSGILNSSNLIITGNILNSTANLSPGIHIRGATNTVITENVVEKASGSGIVVTELSHFVVSNNIVTDSSVGNLNVYSGIYAAPTDDGIIAGNESYNTGDVGQKHGIQIAGGSRIEVVNNNVRNNQTSGILVSSATEIALSSNRWSAGPIEGRVQLGVEPGGCGSGCATVITAEFQANDNILISNVSASGNVGTLSVDTSTNGQFIIKSSSPTDTSIIYWKIAH